MPAPTSKDLETTGEASEAIGPSKTPPQDQTVAGAAAAMSFTVVTASTSEEVLMSVYTQMILHPGQPLSRLSGRVCAPALLALAWRSHLRQRHLKLLPATHPCSDPCLMFALEDTELPNVVPESPQEQTVEFSIDLVDPGYRELLDDPDSPQYIDLAHHLQEQVRLVLVLILQLPAGFSSV